jgi:hypothetical protein
LDDRNILATYWNESNYLLIKGDLFFRVQPSTVAELLTPEISQTSVSKLTEALPNFSVGSTETRAFNFFVEKGYKDKVENPGTSESKTEITTREITTRLTPLKEPDIAEKGQEEPENSNPAKEPDIGGTQNLGTSSAIQNAVSNFYLRKSRTHLVVIGITIYFKSPKTPSDFVSYESLLAFLKKNLQ